MNHRAVWLRTIVSSTVVWIIIYFAGLSEGYFRVACFQGNCPSQLEIYLEYSIILLPILIIALAIVNYLIEFALLRKK